MTLAPYASDPQHTRGRRYPEAATAHRSDFQRDSDRVVHSSAFRRLVYKTQVFLNHEGDLFRTRLTHSLEVAQLARSIARALRLNEDLVEAIALAHDLGHTPFGHAGQTALNDCMKAHGGFEHNLQSLRVVDELEQRYPAYDGLNLCFETREGILKHCSVHHARALEVVQPGGVGRRFLDRSSPSLEAQLCNLADEMAYNAHDVDDGVRSGLLRLEQLEGLPLFDPFRRAILAEYPSLGGRRLLYESLRRMLSAQVHDVIETTQAALSRLTPEQAKQVRQQPPLVRFSTDMALRSDELKRFLINHLYRHPQVVASTDQAQQVVYDLFAAYSQHPSELPPEYAARGQSPRVVADYIAGMTDRFAAGEHARLTGRATWA